MFQSLFKLGHLGVFTMLVACGTESAETIDLESIPESSTSAVLVRTCHNFTALTRSYSVGEVFNTADATITFHRFELPTGIPAFNGQASAANSNLAGGTPPKELDLNHIMVHVNPNTSPRGAEYLYAEVQGNVNFRVNDDFRNVTDLDALNGATVGGSDIVVTRVPIAGGDRGLVTITPQAGVTLNRFGIGGEAFRIDDLCIL